MVWLHLAWFNFSCRGGFDFEWRFMNTEEILEKAIKIALDRGWLFAKKKATLAKIIDAVDYGEELHIVLRGRSREYSFGAYEELIFNHDFAKALWPCKELDMYHEEICIWKHHLQQMVIADDPIKYLGENING